jgi:aryl-alcohol dehydrogenase-like predicted oxidoreductase
MASTLTLAGREIPRIGLGTNRLSDASAHVDFLRAAVAAGVRHIDTAHLYTGGESEAVIGAALEGLADASDVVVATKGGYRPGEGRPEVLRGQIEQSLRALRREVIDVYYLHRVDPETPLEETLGVLREAVDRGEIREVGISDVDVATITRAREVVPIAAVQNHYNLAERGYDEVVDFCAAEGIVFVPYFPLKGEGGGAADEIAARLDVTASAVKLAWLLQRSPTVLPIPGTLSIEHLRENLEALSLELSAEDVAALG